MQRRAFTLVELLTVVSMIGIAGGLAAFTMSEQIVDARAKSEANTVLQDLRAEHRSAREQMFGLKVHSTGHEVTFQNTRGEDCTDPVGDARTVTYKAAQLEIVSPPTGACFNARGEPDLPGGSSGGGIIVGPPSALSLSTPEAPESTASAPQETLLAIKADLSNPGRQFLVPLRVDRAGIVDLGGKSMSLAQASTTLDEMKAAPDEALTRLEKDVGDVLVSTVPTVPPFPDPNGALPPGCVLDALTQAMVCDVIQ